MAAAAAKREGGLAPREKICNNIVCRAARRLDTSEREEVFMKMKSAVLASALVAVSAAFADATSLYDSDVIYQNWITEEVSSTEITEDNPVFLDNNGAAATASDGYAVTAVVSVVIHAAVPTSAPTNITVNSNSVSPKGSICAAYDNNGMAKWYGLSSSGWEELTRITTTPEDAQSYTLVTEFDDTTTGTPKVRYWVGNECSVWYTSGHANALQKVGLAGTGYYTKVVGLLVNAWTGTSIEAVPITISKTMLAAMGVSTANTTPAEIVTALKTPQANQIATWANYVLGIDGTKEANKPFAAPVQNSTASTLTFKLGGVKPPADTGATVTYAVETLTSPTDESSGNLEYKSASATTDITLESSAVRYYRVKVKIDQAN